MYSSREKTAINRLKSYENKLIYEISDKDKQMAKIILNLIEKQNKIINEMTEYLAIVRDCPNEDFGRNLDCENRCNNTDELYAECWRIYFEEKIKEDK